jgi:type IV secretory pathway VirB2 component (pilin)
VQLPAKFPRSFDALNESRQEARVIENRWKIRVAKTRAAVLRRGSIALGVALTLATRAFAQGNSPWENAVNVLQQAFTGPIAKGLALIAIVIGGLTFAFGEGGSKRTFAGILFGLGMALLAVNFLSWLFGV